MLKIFRKFYCVTSVKEIEFLCVADQNQDLKTSICEPTKFKNSSPTVKYLRKDEILCDVKLETDDGKIVICHKVVLISASPYFCAMFCSKFEEQDKDVVKIRELDSTVLQLLVDYIYTGEIVITDENVQVVLPAANIFQLDYVVDVCTRYLHTQMDASNCLGINALADVYSCMELMTSSEQYIKEHFLDVVKGDEFLSLSSQQLIELISCNDIAAPYEEQIFECVIKWLKFELECRKDFLPVLMEHVRLPLLVSTPEILKQVLDEPLLKNSPNYKDYTLEVLQFNSLKLLQNFTIPQTIRCTPRQFGGLRKVILMFNLCDNSPKCYTEWYDPSTKLRENAPGMNHFRRDAGLGIIKNRFVFVAGGANWKSSKSVNILDLSLRSPCWLLTANMLDSREYLGVGVIDDCLYAVGGNDGNRFLKSAEVFDIRSRKWRMVSSMSITRSRVGVGVVNNRLYVVGGYNGYTNLKSVECYDATLDTWTFINNMSVARYGVGVGVLNGLLYAVGGHGHGLVHSSVEALNPSTGIWCTVADMHLCRAYPGVFALDGLLYVIGGRCGFAKYLNSIEIYNPNTNTWAMEEFTINDVFFFGGVVVDRPLRLQ